MLVGGGGAGGVGDEGGPVRGAIGRDLDLVAGDGGAAGTGRGRPGEVDPGAPAGRCREVGRGAGHGVHRHRGRVGGGERRVGAPGHGEGEDKVGARRHLRDRHRGLGDRSIVKRLPSPRSPAWSAPRHRSRSCPTPHRCRCHRASPCPRRPGPFRHRAGPPPSG